mmetsp:Transcript_14244/g.31101  ORF Transcript_14244/g.31101 Transcript_14244/m.31101 type:complete len:207 (+) Transcript_14244:315-935(+)
MSDPVMDIPAPVEPSEVPTKDSKLEQKDTETATAADSVNSDAGGGTDKPTGGPIVSSSKKTRPSYKYDPDKITLRFLFANNDGLTVTIECDPSDTVGEVKGALMSVWPDSLPECTGGESLRLICMGKGYLMPESRTLKDCEIPVFKTHPTPINVTVRPDFSKEDPKNALKKKDSAASNRGGGRSGQASANSSNTASVDQGCSCAIL